MRKFGFEPTSIRGDLLACKLIIGVAASQRPAVSIPIAKVLRDKFFLAIIKYKSNLSAILNGNSKTKNLKIDYEKKSDITRNAAKFSNAKVVTIYMENEDITNHFEWAIMLLKHQFDKDPYSLTTDQVEVLRLHHQIEFDNKFEE